MLATCHSQNHSSPPCFIRVLFHSSVSVVNEGTNERLTTGRPVRGWRKEVQDNDYIYKNHYDNISTPILLYTADILTKSFSVHSFIYKKINQFILYIHLFKVQPLIFAFNFLCVKRFFLQKILLETVAYNYKFSFAGKVVQEPSISALKLKRNKSSQYVYENRLGQLVWEV